MRLLLINPLNATFGFTQQHRSRWARYRLWKPLGLMVVAGLTPSKWKISIVDENLGVPDYANMPQPDLVGITAFTSQAERSYELARELKAKGIPVVMGGIHASMCTEEALCHVDAVVVGEAESVWGEVLEDARAGALKREYRGTLLDMKHSPAARHDLLAPEYHFGSIQTSRGCPLNCTFCSVTAFNGAKFRRRSIDSIVSEFESIPEKTVLIVDDNFIGTRRDHIAQTKELLRALIRSKARKNWVTQVTINFADDEELLTLAAAAGCSGVFIGFEAIDEHGLAEVGKKFNAKQAAKSRDFRASVRRIQKHGMAVVGSFVMGLEGDKKGIGKKVADTASAYGVDILNAVYLTPFPGTRLWDKMKGEDRIAADQFPADWRYYTLTFPVAKYKHLSWRDMIEENRLCNARFYSRSNIMRRVVNNVVAGRQPIMTLVANLSYRATAVRHFYDKFSTMDLSRGSSASDAG